MHYMNDKVELSASEQITRIVQRQSAMEMYAGDAGRGCKRAPQAGLHRKKHAGDMKYSRIR